jgi:sensor c-di-GMP phosphodiesterase-like protein
MAGVWADCVNTKAKQRLHIESELRQAITQGEIEAFYQPIVRISDEKIVGAEALDRWHRDGANMWCLVFLYPLLKIQG